ICFLFFFFFFFQAEDGIRDDLVTGVQTCALPISSPRPSRGATRAATGRPRRRTKRRRRPRPSPRPTTTSSPSCSAAAAASRRPRSEERRVGKEVRSGGWRDIEKKKKKKEKTSVRI